MAESEPVSARTAETDGSTPFARSLLYTTGFVLLTSISYGILDLLDEQVLGHVSLNEVGSDGSGTVISIADRLLSQFNNFDPDDPNDFRKVVKTALAAGMSAVTLAKLFGMNEGTARRWGDGKSLPASVARKSIFNAIFEWLSANK